jgi:hypothetical protein
MIETEETQIDMSSNAGVKESNKTVTVTIITSTLRKEQIFLIMRFHANFYRLGKKQQNKKQAIFCLYRA